MRSPERGDPGEACIFDADLFAQKPDFVVELVSQSGVTSQLSRPCVRDMIFAYVSQPTR
jgi:hypothetical protein